MRNAIIVTALLALSAHAAHAQDVIITRDIEKLAGKAVNTVNVTLEGPMLRLASKFLSADDPEQRVVKDLISSLQGIYVRSYEFSGPSQYSQADVESLRAQLKVPTWSRVVGVRSTRDGEDVDVFLKMEKDRIAGLVVIATQALHLTVVNIVGSIDLERLASLGGQLGIPKLEIERKRD
jgi:Domain of unknown function (DUF4252)